MNDNDFNLLNDPRIQQSEITKKFSLRGQTVPRPVYRIPLDLVYYNNKNGRIATLISKWEADNGYKISELDREKYNETIENYIIKSNETAYKKTKDNIKALSQREAGVVLSNGCIIDGNRRYTCLRRLNQEDGSGKYGYFEAVILNPDITADEKEIKRLELELQHGQDEKVSYNPIESLIDVYKTIKEDNILTIKEYADNSSKTESAVKKDLAQAEIIIDFLDYINAPGKYYIAVDLQLDASVFEIYNIKQKLSDEEWEKAKIVLYDNMLAKTKGDIKLLMRDIKTIINSEYFDSYFEKHYEIAKPLHQKLKETEMLDSNFIKDNIRSDEVIKNKMLSACEDYKYIVGRTNVKRMPIEQMEDVYGLLSKIDQDSITHMVGEERQQFINNYNQVKEKINEIGSKINEIR